MAVLVAPELALPGGHPQGHSCHLRENFVNHLWKPKLFWRLPYHLSWPPLAATLGQLVNPVWDWWRWRPCQESRLLERVRRLDVQLSNSSSPAPLLSTVLSCCTLPTRSLVIHTILHRWPQIENLPSLFSLEMCVGVCRKALLSLATHPIAISTRFNR